MAQKLGNGMRLALPVIVAGGLMLLANICSCNPAGGKTGRSKGDTSEQFDQTSVLGANAGCYVCHITFVGEELSKTHLKAKVTCTRCHGTSAGHANDENIGATKPDVTFGRDKVDAMCLECHKKHDVEDSQAELICTNCHGAHKIKQGIPEKE